MHPLPGSPRVIRRLSRPLPDGPPARAPSPRRSRKATACSDRSDHIIITSDITNKYNAFQTYARASNSEIPRSNCHL